MRLSMIAACLLLVSASPVLACIEHGPEQTGWFQEMPSSSWETTWSRVERTWWYGMPGAWLFGAGSASVALVGVSFRAYTRAAGQAAMLER
jgi:hypothetical protein